MTSLDPSHAPWLGRSTDRKAGEAVHTSAPAPPHPRRTGSSDADEDDSVDSDAPDYHERKRAQRESARSRGRVPVPPIPDLRFEQGYLLSILPFLHPSHSRPEPTSEKAQHREDETEAVEDVGLVKDATKDIFVSPLTVEWAPLLYVTARDQIVSPLLQGLLWGTIGVGATGFMLWRQLQPKATAWSRLLHANLVAWGAALLGAEALAEAATGGSS